VDGACDRVDAIFSLLRIETGAFDFNAGVRVTPQHPAEDVLPLLEEAQRRLAEWGPIVAVVPSLSHWLALAEEPNGERVSLSAEEWALVVAIGDGRSVADVLQRQGLGEFEGCQKVKALVEAGLVTVSGEARPGLPTAFSTATASFSPATAAHVPADAPLLSQALLSADEVVVEPGDLVIEAGDFVLPESELGAHDIDVMLEEGDLVLNESDVPATDGSWEAPANWPGASANWSGEAGDERNEFSPSLVSAVSGLSGSSAGSVVSSPEDVLSPEDVSSLEFGAVPVPAVVESAAEVASPAVEPQPVPPVEPINRGLLLKFLSTVRS
jgi:hypothetical protein